MLGYVLMNIETGMYVAPPGQEKSFTDRLQDARVLGSREEAERARCVESERVEAIGDLLARC